MVNTEEFIKRIEKVLSYYGLSASSFADKIGVQRSSISHLLSGRNKPSLDFILKITEVFPEVDLYWILNGKGSFPKSIDLKNEEQLQKKTDTNPLDLFSKETSIDKIPINENMDKKKSNTQNLETLNSEEPIDCIVVFYKNGTFKNYTQN